jgi:hypothetical protein
MIMYRTALVTTLGVFALAASLAAQSKPNFSGTWKMNVEKSDFGPLPPSNSRTDIIDHNDPTLKINVSDDGAQGKQEYVLNLTTDGKEVTNNAGGTEVKNSATWEGSGLVVGTKLKFQDTDVTVRSVWTLSADGKTLTQTAHLVAGALGETDQTFVFEKASGGAAAASAPASAAKATSSAGSRANYSGTWKMNVEKSDFGPLPPSNSRTDIIDHKDPVLKVNVSDDGAQGKQEYVLSMTTDGKEVTNNAGGLEVKNSASWEGPSLVVGTKLKFQDTDVIVRSVWVLSADGKTLTETAHLVAGALGETDQTFVFEKQ